MSNGKNGVDKPVTATVKNAQPRGEKGKNNPYTSYAQCVAKTGNSKRCRTLFPTGR